MSNRGKVGTVGHSRCDRMTMVTFLISTAALFLFATHSSVDGTIAFIPMMKADALFLMSSSYHYRRPPQSRAPGSGPSTSASPQPESNTMRRRRESRSFSHLIAFYGMVLGRNGERKLADEAGPSMGKSPEDNDDDFSKEMLERKQEFRQRLEHFRGRGRWGGYSLVAIQQDKRAALPVVSMPTKTATTTAAASATSIAPKVTTELMKQRRQSRRLRNASPILQITDIHQYKEEVVDSTDASLVVVRFYASWCKACKAIESNYHRLSDEFPSSVKFVEVPLTKENAYLHKGLGVPSLPFAHVYHNDNHSDIDGAADTSSSSRLVHELKINKSKFSEFKRIIRSYVDKECDVFYGGESCDKITVSSIPERRQISMKAVENENETIPA